MPRPIWRTLQQLRLLAERARYRPRWVEHDFAGHPLRLYLADPSGERSYDHDWPDLPQLLHAVAGAGTPATSFNAATGEVDEAPPWWMGKPPPAVTVDDLTQRYGGPDVLFIDVEGYEGRVLEGGPATLSSARPDCFVEVHVEKLPRYGDSLATVLQVFADTDYRLYVASEAERVFLPFPGRGDVLEHRHFLIAVAS